MGLGPSAIRFLAREHKRKPFISPVLTLGRQSVWATYDEVRKILISEGIQPQPLEQDWDLTTKIPTQDSKYISDTTLFRLFNVEELRQLDISDYQCADIILDMNKPIPDELQSQFNLIIDGGTLEHIFDIKQAMMNISLLLKSGGRIIHLSPASNHIGHGFYSFSPGLFFDYYLANKFIDLKAYIADQGPDPTNNRWKLYRYEYDSYRGVVKMFRSKYMVHTIFVAEKTDSSTHNVVPAQDQFKVPQNASHIVTSPLKQMIKNYMPSKMKRMLGPIAIRVETTITEIKRSEVRGLKYLGKL